MEPFKHQFTLPFEPDKNSVGLNAKVTKKKCMCICHTRYEVMHMEPCCDNGYVWEVTIEPKTPEEANKELWKYSRQCGIYIEPL